MNKPLRKQQIITDKHYYAIDAVFDNNNNLFPKTLTNKIICADSLVQLKKIPDNSVDLIFTSPPYNFGMNYTKIDDSSDWDNYFEQLFKIFEECIRVLKYSGRIVINIMPAFGNYVPTHHFISNFFVSKKMIWKGEIIWEKNNYNCNYTTWGSWKSPSSPYLKYTWEFLEIFCKGDLKKVGKKTDIDIDENSFKEWVTAKWVIPPETQMKKYGHPAMFPEELAYRVLKLFSYKNDVVLDPFCGTGTTCLVAKKTNRFYLGIDISENYCKIAKDRLHESLI